MRALLELLGPRRRVRKIPDRLRKMFRGAHGNRKNGKRGGVRFEIDDAFRRKFMLKKSIFGLLLASAFALAAAAQSVYTPEKGSAERTAILNALRVPVERELKQKIVFQVEDFNVQGNWAFLGGAPQTGGGGKP